MAPHLNNSSVPTIAAILLVRDVPLQEVVAFVLLMTVVCPPLQALGVGLARRVHELLHRDPPS